MVKWLLAVGELTVGAESLTLSDSLYVAKAPMLPNQNKTLQMSGIRLEDHGGNLRKIARATADKKRKILYLKLQKPVEPGNLNLNE
jgi:hypothetical protein